MGQSNNKRRTSIGFLFWIAFILLVIVIFLANRSNIESVVENTGVLEVIRDRVAQDDSEPETTEDDTDPLVLFDTDSSGEPTRPEADRMQRENPADGRNQPGDPPQIEPTGETETPEPTVEPEPRVVTTTRPDTAPEQEPPPPETEPLQRSPSPDPARPNRLSAGLYFIKVADNGRTYPQKVVRPVYYDTSPLTETINALIEGPRSAELNGGLLNLIPEGTQLISASVRGGVAYLNFNQAFRFNSLGAEGTVGQLLQVIYSSTEFPTVERVQFLIEGEQLDYLGGDGIFVGTPLGRDAFS
jgi:spore germination protein GerM